MNRDEYPAKGKERTMERKWNPIPENERRAENYIGTEPDALQRGISESVMIMLQDIATGAIGYAWFLKSESGTIK